MSITLDSNTCPRCLRGIPSDLMRGQYPGALSRTDNSTEICSECGQLEAMEDFFGEGVTPQADWLFTIVMTPPEMRSQQLTVAEDAAEGAE